MEAESSLSTSEDGEAEDDIRELRARRSVLTNKLAEQQKRRDKIQVRPAPWASGSRKSSGLNAVWVEPIAPSINDQTLKVHEVPVGDKRPLHPTGRSVVYRSLSCASASSIMTRALD